MHVLLMKSLFGRAKPDQHYFGGCWVPCTMQNKAHIKHAASGVLECLTCFASSLVFFTFGYFWLFPWGTSSIIPKHSHSNGGEQHSTIFFWGAVVCPLVSGWKTGASHQGMLPQCSSEMKAGFHLENRSDNDLEAADILDGGEDDGVSFKSLMTGRSLEG